MVIQPKLNVPDHLFPEMRTNKLKKFVGKHKTSIALGAALAASLVAHALRPPMRLADASAYYITDEDVEYINRLLEADQKNQPE